MRDIRLRKMEPCYGFFFCWSDGDTFETKMRIVIPFFFRESLPKHWCSWWADVTNGQTKSAKRENEVAIRRGSASFALRVPHRWKTRPSLFLQTIPAKVRVRVHFIFLLTKTKERERKHETHRLVLIWLHQCGVTLPAATDAPPVPLSTWRKSEVSHNSVLVSFSLVFPSFIPNFLMHIFFFFLVLVNQVIVVICLPAYLCYLRPEKDFCITRQVSR